jgi:CBS-domain-containing membrane protein
VVTRKDLQKLATGSDPREISEVVHRSPATSYPDEPLRIVVNRMAETGLTRLPVIEEESKKLVGIISLQDLLHARVRHLEEERRRERVLRIHLPFSAAALEEGGQTSGVSNGSDTGSSGNTG